MSSVRQAAESAPLRQAVAELVTLSDERDVWLRRVIDADASGYARGLAEGVALGRAIEAAESAAAWQRIARPIARSSGSHADLERRRWRLRGEDRTRATFGKPHPDDFKGTGAA
jgi:hypothetical protein